MAALQQLQPEIALSRHIGLLGLERIEIVEGVPQQFLGQLVGEHLRIQRQLGRTLGELGERASHGAIVKARRCKALAELGVRRNGQLN
jgi:hypothetical protein